MPPAIRRVVIVGISTRAPAESAVRSGYEVRAVDAFGDLDLATLLGGPDGDGPRLLVPRRDGGRRYSAAAAVRMAAGLGADAVCYTSNLENHPAAVGRLGETRVLLGNPAAVLRRARDPFLVARTFAALGLRVPDTRRTPPPRPTGAWLLKPRRSGGGHAIRSWRPGQPIPRGAFIQRRLRGTPGSIVFLADGRRAEPLAVTRQLVGDPVYGASGFRYCGSLLAKGLLPREALARATDLASAATEAFGLRGLNGIDFVASTGIPVPVEINPRWTASMELVERAYGVPLFRLHVEACTGRLPGLGLLDRVLPGAFGKAVVFASGSLTMGCTGEWLGDADVSDVPHPGERIRTGRPICTVFATAATAHACRRALNLRAGRVRRGRDPATGRAA